MMMCHLSLDCLVSRLIWDFHASLHLKDSHKHYKFSVTLLSLSHLIIQIGDEILQHQHAVVGAEGILVIEVEWRIVFK